MTLNEKFLRIGAGLLIAAVFVSALLLVLVRHENRRLFIRLQDLQEESYALEVEWGRLQLEQAALARPSRIEKEAREKLGMRIPPPETVMVLKPR